MVKTVLHELVKLRGTAIKGHLSMVPIDMEPQPIILAYIDLNLQVMEINSVLLYLVIYVAVFFFKKYVLLLYMCLPSLLLYIFSMIDFGGS